MAAAIVASIEEPHFLLEDRGFSAAAFKTASNVGALFDNSFSNESHRNESN